MTEEHKLTYVSNWYLFIPFFGLIFQHILDIFGICNGRAAIEYYGHVHHNYTNKLLHMTLLPIAAYGYALGVPALFRLSYDDAALMRNWFYLTLVIHYSFIDKGVAGFFFIDIFSPAIFSTFTL